MEVVAIDEGFGDVEAQRGVSLGDHEIEVVMNEEGIDNEDGDLVELRPREVAQEDVVAEDVNKGAIGTGSVKGETEREGREKRERSKKIIKKKFRMCYSKL
jgi:hypothetical protein